MFVGVFFIWGWLGIIADQPKIWILLLNLIDASSSCSTKHWTCTVIDATARKLVPFRHSPSITWGSNNGVICDLPSIHPSRKSMSDDVLPVLSEAKPFPILSFGCFHFSKFASHRSWHRSVLPAASKNNSSGNVSLTFSSNWQTNQKAMFCGNMAMQVSQFLFDGF